MCARRAYRQFKSTVFLFGPLKTKPPNLKTANISGYMVPHRIEHPLELLQSHKRGLTTVCSPPPHHHQITQQVEKRNREEKNCIGTCICEAIFLWLILLAMIIYMTKYFFDNQTPYNNPCCCLDGIKDVLIQNIQDWSDLWDHVHKQGWPLRYILEWEVQSTCVPKRPPSLERSKR